MPETNEEKKEETKEKEKRVWSKDDLPKAWGILAGSFLILMLACAFPISAAFGFLMPEPESIETWFQRSGSATVLSAIAAEYLLYQLYGLVNELEITEFDRGVDPFAPLKKPYIWLRRVGVVVAIGGTVIWGYGDLLLQLPIIGA